MIAVGSNDSTRVRSRIHRHASYAAIGTTRKIAGNATSPHTAMPKYCAHAGRPAARRSRAESQKHKMSDVHAASGRYDFNNKPCTSSVPFNVASSAVTPAHERGNHH